MSGADRDELTVMIALKFKDGCADLRISGLASARITASSILGHSPPFTIPEVDSGDSRDSGAIL